MRDLIARALVGAITTAAFVAGASAAADAQDARFTSNRSRFDFQVMGGTGISTLSGEAHSGVMSNYDDLWGDGTMNWFSLAALFPLAQREKLTVALGPVLQFDQATYGGGTDTDAFGATLHPDDFTTTRVMGGAKLQLGFSKANSPVSFHLGPQLMLGWARHDAVNATVTAPGMGTLGGGLFYRETDVFAFDLSLRLGLAFHATDFLDVGINAGLGFSIMGGPDNGSAVFSQADASEILSGYGTLGLTLTFKAPSLDGAAVLGRDSGAPARSYSSSRRGTNSNHLGYRGSR